MTGMHSTLMKPFLGMKMLEMVEAVESAEAVKIVRERKSAKPIWRPVEPWIVDPVRIIVWRWIGVRVGVRSLWIRGWRWHGIDLRRQSRRLLGHAPATVGLQTGSARCLNRFSIDDHRNGVVAAGRLVARGPCWGLPRVRYLSLAICTGLLRTGTACIAAENLRSAAVRRLLRNSRAKDER